MKKFLAMALTLALALTVFALPVSADEATETKTFSIWTWLGSAEGWGCQSYDEIPCFTAAEQATGIDITWEIESDTSTFDLMMSSGDTTDGIYYAWNPTRTAKYSAAGLIVDIAPYIEEYAPNLYALIESDETIKKQLYSADGGIYFVPWITSDRRLVYGEGFGIRQDWLDKLGLEMPTTTDELLEVLRQVLAASVCYVGCIGSRRKAALLRERLAALGFSPADLERIWSPIGLPIGGDTPAEIAVSITAQLIAHRAGRLPPPGAGGLWGLEAGAH